MRHVTSITDLSVNDIQRIFALTKELKDRLLRGNREPLLPGRVLALLFEKPSLRTRVSFEAAMRHLGGSSLYLGTDVGWGKRESPADFSRVLSQLVDAVVIRSKSHESLLELARYATCPVINGLTDLSHPCQALADLYTLRELHGSVRHRRLAFIGDANNVARSLALACGKLDLQFALAGPQEYWFDESAVARMREAVPALDLVQTTDPREAVEGACAIYTDVWTSMGQEAEKEQRRQAFTPYQVNGSLLSAAPRDCCFLHCLPANRGEEVTDDVIDGPQSVVIQQASNRLHVQKGLLAWLFGLTTPLPA